jgi:hypothetical protein
MHDMYQCSSIPGVVSPARQRITIGVEIWLITNCNFS